jgi:hypothetical protein
MKIGPRDQAPRDRFARLARPDRATLLRLLDAL